MTDDAEIGTESGAGADPLAQEGGADAVVAVDASVLRENASVDYAHDHTQGSHNVPDHDHPPTDDGAIQAGAASQSHHAAHGHHALHADVRVRTQHSHDAGHTQTQTTAHHTHNHNHTRPSTQPSSVHSLPAQALLHYSYSPSPLTQAAPIPNCCYSRYFRPHCSRRCCHC